MHKKEEAIKINLSKPVTLNESWLRMFGENIVSILRAMFGGYSIPVNIVGSQEQINSFANAIKNEKNYIEAYKKYGLDNPYTYKNKYALDAAVKEFERKTGIFWPFR